MKRMGTISRKATLSFSFSLPLSMETLKGKDFAPLGAYANSFLQDYPNVLKYWDT